MFLSLLRQKIKKTSQKTASVEIPKIKVEVISFDDDCLNNSGKFLADYLVDNPYLSVHYYDEVFDKDFLDLQSRNFFDFIDSGKSILKNTKADVLIWGYREKDKIRLNFQTHNQYEKQSMPVFSLLNSLYLPLSYFQDNKFSESIINLILATIMTALKKEVYLNWLKEIIQKINNSGPPKELEVFYMPYILNLLALSYLYSIHDEMDDNCIRTIADLLKKAIITMQANKEPVLKGVLYSTFGQLYQLASEYVINKKYDNCRLAIDFYSTAQKYFNRQAYPYDFGITAYCLSKLYFSYWKYTSDIQSLRNAIFQLRESQKVFSKIVFPQMWAQIQKELGLYFSMMSVFSKSDEIAKIAIASYKRYQEIYEIHKYPLEWAQAQENIGNIFYECGKIYNNEEYFEEAINYYNDSISVFEKYDKTNDCKRIQVYLTKADNYILNMNID